MEPQLPAPSGEKAIYHKYLKTQIHSVKQVRFKFWVEQGRGNPASVLATSRLSIRVTSPYKNECLNFTKSFLLCKLNL